MKKSARKFLDGFSGGKTRPKFSGGIYRRKIFPVETAYIYIYILYEIINVNRAVGKSLSCYERGHEFESFEFFDKSFFFYSLRRNFLPEISIKKLSIYYRFMVSAGSFSGVIFGGFFRLKIITGRNRTTGKNFRRVFYQRIFGQFSANLSPGNQRLSYSVKPKQNYNSFLECKAVTSCVKWTTS